jgi:hypothetical protein
MSSLKMRTGKRLSCFEKPQFNPAAASTRRPSSTNKLFRLAYYREARIVFATDTRLSGGRQERTDSLPTRVARTEVPSSCGPARPIALTFSLAYSLALGTAVIRWLRNCPKGLLVSAFSVLRCLDGFGRVLNGNPLHFYYTRPFCSGSILRNSLKNMVGLGRLELPARGLGNRCSVHLSYRPTDALLANRLAHARARCVPAIIAATAMAATSDRDQPTTTRVPPARRTRQRQGKRRSSPSAARSRESAQR